MLVVNGTELIGHRSGGSVQYLTLINGQLISSDNIGELLLLRREAGLAPEVDHGAISHLLHDGFVPQPRTVYRDIFSISIGYRAQLRRGRLEFREDFPFELSSSRCDQTPNTRDLLDRLVEATANACNSGRDSILLLSGGLDSTSLAIAAGELGRTDFRCITYGEPERHSEVMLAQDMCRRLGLRHEAHILDTTSSQICRDLVAYAGAAPEPCADPALTATISSIRRYGGSNTVVLDGSGSDFYFWSPPRTFDLLKLRFGLSRLPLVGHVRSYLPVYLPYERLLSTPLEPFLLHGSWLRHCDTRRFYGESVDTHEFWLNAFHDQAHAPRNESRYRNRAIYVGPGAHMMKTRNAAASIGASARFPWADPLVAEYCFHLPESSRFSRPGKKSKVIVRDMLRQFAAYNDALIGKRPFLFGKRRFLEHNLAFCQEQILDCALWNKGIHGEVQKLSDMFRRGHATENALLALTMVSLWHNHWFSRNMMSMLTPASLPETVCLQEAV